MITLSGCSGSKTDVSGTGSAAGNNAVGTEAGDSATAGGTNGSNTAGNGADSATGKTADDSKNDTGKSADGFVFITGDTVISMNQDTSEFLDKLGEPDNYAESTSCAFEGLDKIYSFKGFDLYTYPDGDKDRVSSVYFTDNSAKTPTGIGLGSTVDELLEAYGNDYTEEWEVYTYTKDKTEISFLSTDGIIDSIEFRAIVE